MLGKWLCYVIGQALHAALQLSAIRKSHNQTWKVVLQGYALPLATRVFLCTMLFMLLVAHPDLLVPLLKFTGVDPTELTLQMSMPIAGFFGFGSDSLLSLFVSKIPILKGQVPQLDPSPPSAP